MRAVLFYGDAPGAADSIYTAVAAVVALVIGASVFSRADDRIATEV
jgi:ABC-type polysaccharide/polyol phosphate export permease